ncbi:MAG: hypothetical protein WD767_17375 [Alphaproteobacteria bacterium]
MAKNPKRVSLRDRYEIAVDEPLSTYDNPPAMAFKVRHLRDASRELMALVCDPKLPVRLDMINSLSKVEIPYLMALLDWGVVDWPPEGRRCPVLIYEPPAGGRVAASLDDDFEPMREEEIIKFFAEPANQVLREFREFDITHRAIRPNNLYFGGARGSRLILGDCISSPPAMAQSFVYEPIEACMANPAGRGMGGSADDMYELGVTILALMIGHSPCRGMSDQEILNAKLSMGSYGALTQSSRISLTMMEALRGLLTDDPDERWTVDDVGMWSNGHRGSPVQQSMQSRAARSYSFMNKEHFTCRELAHTMVSNWNKSINIIRDGSVDTWLRRALGDDTVVNAFNEAKDVPEAMATDDNLIGRCCIALDPAAPIRYRDFSAIIDGIPNMMALYSESGETRNAFAAILQYELIEFWEDNQPRPRIDLLTLYRDLKRAREVMARTASGEGIERVIYDLNPRLACQSPLVDAYYILDINSVLPALDWLAANQDDVRYLIDRHLAAYIATHFSGLRGSEMRDLDNQADPNLPILASIRLLSQIQERDTRIKPYTNLGQLAVKMLAPTIKRYHNRETRERISGAMREAGATGRLSELLAIADNSQVLDDDNRRFERASHEYRDIARRLEQLDSDKRNRMAIARELGGQVSSVISGVLTTVSLLVIVLFTFIMAS